MEGSRNVNNVVAEPLAVYNYEDWFEWVKNYLISKDLWEVTISSSEIPSENAGEEFARWRRKNAAALHVIRISCGSENLPLIREDSEAKVAWDNLYRGYNEPPPPPPPPPPPRQGELDMGILYKAICDDIWFDVRTFIIKHPNSLDPEHAATTGETPLHVAVKFGRVGIVEELVRLVSPEYLETLDSSHNTPLLIAATYSGVIPIAKCLVKKNSHTLAIPFAGKKDLVPATMAFHNGLNEMGLYLYAVTPLEVFEPRNGRCGLSFLRKCLLTGELDVALDLLQRCNELLFADDLEMGSTIENIALIVPFSLNKSELPFWKRWIYHYIKIPSATPVKDLRREFQNELWISQRTEHCRRRSQYELESSQGHQGTEHLPVDIQHEGESNQGHQGTEHLPVDIQHEGESNQGHQGIEHLLVDIQHEGESSQGHQGTEHLPVEIQHEGESNQGRQGTEHLPVEIQHEGESNQGRQGTQHLPVNIHHLPEDIQHEGESNQGHQGPGRRHWLSLLPWFIFFNLLHWLVSRTVSRTVFLIVSRIVNLFEMKEIRKMKQQHEQSVRILDFICKNMISIKKGSNDNLMVMNKERKGMIVEALRYAAREENVEFLLLVTKEYPELIFPLTFCQPKRPFFFDAVANRKADTFNLLHGFRFKHVITSMIPNDSNTLLHKAAGLAPLSYLNRISGAALQMQRELQWFKVVENMVDPGIRTVINNQRLTPLDLFKKSHTELRKEGEKWMKETSSSCSVVGALIVTIMFAVAFTVPGGNDQTSGYPIFLEKKLFKVFLIADTLSLFSSTTSVLTFLGILTSRYAEEDFLYSLPTKLIIGLSTLFLSIATMMIAFSATIIIMLQHNSPRLMTLLPVILLAGVPITLFVLLQFPLLVEIISSTYGPSIFKKKVEKWP